MRKTLISFLIVTILFSCQPIDSSNYNSDREKEHYHAYADSSSKLVKKLSSLNSNCLDFSDLYSAISKSDSHENSFHKQEFHWLYDLHRADSIHFERADEIKPLCKLFENDSILSVVFTDMYDYKQALHVFNFSKTSDKPVSSFILYSVGGDAEDFWNIDAKKLNALTFMLTETEGHVNNIETADTTFIDFRKTTKVSINTRTGKVSREVEKIERNIVETK